MNIQPTRDWNKLRGILMHPEVYGRTTEDEDFASPETEEALCAGMHEDFVTPLLVSDEGTPVAAYVLIYLNPGVYRLHAHVLPEHSKKHSAQATQLAVRWAWNHLNMRKLEAVIPTKYSNIFAQALKLGFMLRDVLDNDCRQGGRTYASYYMVMYSNGISKRPIR